MSFPETLNIHHTSKLMQSVQASLKDNHREGAFYKLKATNCMPRATHQGDMAECTIQPKILQVRWEIMLYLPNHCIPPHPINDFLFHIDLRLDPLLKKGSSLELNGKRLRLHLSRTYIFLKHKYQRAAFVFGSLLGKTLYPFFARGLWFMLCSLSKSSPTELSRWARSARSWLTGFPHQLCSDILSSRVPIPRFIFYGDASNCHQRREQRFGMNYLQPRSSVRCPNVTSFLCLTPQLPNKCFKHENQERDLFSNYRFRSQIMFSLLKKPALSPAGKIRAIILLWIRGESKKISNLTLCILTASAL